MRDDQRQPPQGDLGVLVAGIPCQPYSNASASRSKLGGVTGHKKFGLTAAMVHALSVFMPRAFIFENVIGFSKRVKGLRKTPLADFLAQLVAQNLYRVETFTLPLSEWVHAERDRL